MKKTGNFPRKNECLLRYLNTPWSCRSRLARQRFILAVGLNVLQSSSGVYSPFSCMWRRLLRRAFFLKSRLFFLSISSIFFLILDASSVVVPGLFITPHPGILNSGRSICSRFIDIKASFAHVYWFL